MKKILFIFHDSNLTGASIALFRLVNLMKDNNDFHLLIHIPHSRGKFIDLVDKYDFNVFFFDKFYSKKNMIKFLFKRIIYYIKFFFLILRTGPNLVYSNTILNFEQVLISKLMLKKTILHVHEGANFISKNKFKVKLQLLICSYVFCVSEYSKFSLLNIFNRDIKVIRNGVDFDKFEYIRKKLNKENLRISVVGTVDRNKSQLDAVNILDCLIKSSINCNYSLNFYGKILDKIYFGEINQIIKEKKLDNYIFFHNEIFDQSYIYENTDIVLITSIDESFSLVIIEAAAHSIPVISSSNKGAIEIISDGYNGLIYDHNDNFMASKKIFNLVENNDNYDYLAFNNFFLCRDKFNSKNISLELIKLINKFI